MAIQLECINVIIPLSVLSKCSAIENLDQFLKETAYPGSGCWHDEQLYREGAMNPMDAALIVEKWKTMGLRITKGRGVNKNWNELCVVDTFSGPTLPCSWLKYDSERQLVEYIYLKK